MTIVKIYSGYVKFFGYVKNYSVNTLYLIFRYVNGYFEEIYGNKYLTLVPTNGSKEKIKKYEKLWSKSRDLFKSITKNSDVMIMMKNIYKSNLIQMMN